MADQPEPVGKLEPEARAAMACHASVENRSNWLIRSLKDYGPIAPFLTFLVLLVSVCFASISYLEVSRQNAIQRKAILHQQDNLRRSFQQNTAATVYAAGNETTKVLLQYPELRTFFEAIDDYRAAPPELNDPSVKKRFMAQKHESLNKLFSESDAKTKQRVWTYTEMLADFYEYAFEFRAVLDEDDWATWWHHFCDAYDESPFLQSFLNTRAKWYTIRNYLTLPTDEREKWFASDLKKLNEARQREREQTGLE
jgi:hypothetical protein